MAKKSILILIIVVLLTGMGYAGYTQLLASNKAIISNELSERSKEFLATQQGSESAALGNVNVNQVRRGEHDFDSQRIQVPDCYSLVVPFPVSDSRQNSPCVYYALIESPRGNLTTSLRNVGFRSADEAPDVSLRRSKKDQYRENIVVINQVKYLIFTDTQSGVEKSAFGMHGEQLFTLSLSLGGDDEAKSRQMKKILESVKME